MPCETEEKRSVLAQDIGDYLQTQQQLYRVQTVRHDLLDTTKIQDFLLNVQMDMKDTYDQAEFLILQLIMNESRLLHALNVRMQF